jgi:hypothetical protein
MIHSQFLLNPDLAGFKRRTTDRWRWRE